jgi:CheY-like chemotaxis protein
MDGVWHAFSGSVRVCVLIVEDEPIVLMTTADWLEDAGFKVMTASDGLQAVDLLEQHPGHFTALVTDFHMPLGMTGAHLVIHMRQTCPVIPMIITTAITYVVTESWRLQNGVGVLAKPYYPEALVSMLRAALKG